MVERRKATLAQSPPAVLAETSENHPAGFSAEQTFA